MVYSEDIQKGPKAISQKTEYTIFMVVSEGETPTQAITTNVRSFVSLMKYFGS